MSAVISTQGLIKRYNRKVVVDQLNLEVPQGAIYAFLGDNGAGKTSTIKILVGMHPPYGHSPPTSVFSTPTTFSPAVARRPATSSPPTPKPMTTTSTCRISTMVYS